MTATLIRGNTRELPLADASVDLIVTSPPYWALRSYTDGGQHYDGQIGAEPTPAAYVDSLIECTREWMRVLKSTGSLWVNLGDKYAGSRMDGSSGNDTLANSAGYIDGRARGVGKTLSAGSVPTKSLIGLPWRYAIRCIDDLGLILRAEVIWSKPNGLPESVTDRVRRSHEQWFHLVKSPRYFSAVDNVREPHAPWTLRAYAYEQKNGGYNRRANPNRVDEGDASDYAVANPLGKLPGSVWTVATQPLTVPAELGVDHFAAFPMEWPRRIIRGWSPDGGTVLDPFGGTGTTAMVADALGRRGISVDMSADYCRLARWRTTDPGQRASALQVDKPAVQRVGQMDLFGEAS